MGLDISIRTDQDDEVMNEDYFNDENDYFNKHNLSRTFCNLMNRRHVIDEVPELDQIAKITSIDVSPIYEMEDYPNDDEIEAYLEYEEDEDEKSKIIAEMENNRQKLSGNFPKVYQTIQSLITALQEIDNLPELLLENDFDSLNPSKYFADFKVDKGQGYTNNNFGQDLRNFERFLDYARLKNVETVWFEYY